MKDVRDRRDDDDRENGTNGEDHKGKFHITENNEAELMLVYLQSWTPLSQRTTN